MKFPGSRCDRKLSYKEKPLPALSLPSVPRNNGRILVRVLATLKNVGRIVTKTQFISNGSLVEGGALSWMKMHSYPENAQMTQKTIQNDCLKKILEDPLKNRTLRQTKLEISFSSQYFKLDYKIPCTSLLSTKVSCQSAMILWIHGQIDLAIHNGTQ